MTKLADCFTLAQVAERVGLKANTLRKYAKGQLQPKLTTTKIGQAHVVESKVLDKWISDWQAKKEAKK